MKKIIALLLVMTLTVGMFAACGKKEESTPETPAPESQPLEDPSEPEAPAEVGGVRTGMAVHTNIAKSSPAEEGKEGNAQVDSTVVAVIVDEEGRVAQASIDAAQSKVAFTADGKIVGGIDQTFQSKQEQGDAYGMRAASGIDKEWNEQADAFAAYVIGKTAEEIQGIALEEKVPTDADLSASVTMKVQGYIDAILEAMENAKNIGANVDDKLTIGVVTNMSKSKEADGETAGLIELDSTYTILSVNADGVITSALVDVSEGKIEIDSTGAITNSLEDTFPSKQALGASYGMKGASGIGKEWNEQADAFAAYVTGKTLDEVKGLAVTEGKVEDADLAASVTISVADMMEGVEKAYNLAGVEATATEEATETTEATEGTEADTEATEATEEADATDAATEEAPEETAANTEEAAA